MMIRFLPQPDPEQRLHVTEWLPEHLYKPIYHQSIPQEAPSIISDFLLLQQHEVLYSSFPIYNQKESPHFAAQYFYHFLWNTKFK